jgi:hypothetical protein
MYRNLLSCCVIYEPLSQALNADPDISFDSFDGNAIINSLSSIKAGFNLFFVPDEWPGCWSVLSLGIILSEDTSTRMMIATMMIQL